MVRDSEKKKMHAMRGSKDLYSGSLVVSQPQVIKFTSCLPMVGGSLRVLRLLSPLKPISSPRSRNLKVIKKCVHLNDVWTTDFDMMLCMYSILYITITIFFYESSVFFENYPLTYIFILLC
jgi:hypothetical protein